MHTVTNDQLIVVAREIATHGEQALENILRTVGIIDVKKEGFIQYILSQLGDLAESTTVIFDDDLSTGWIYFKLYIYVGENPDPDMANRDIIIRVINTIVDAFPDISIDKFAFYDEDDSFVLECGMVPPRATLTMIEGNAD